MTAPRPIMFVLAVADLARSRAFYDAAFGWPVRIDVPVLVEYEVAEGLGLALYVKEGFGANTEIDPTLPPPGQISGVEVYMHCEDPAAAAARLVQAGARELSALAPRNWGDEAAYFADPDGHVLAVARPLG